MLFSFKDSASSGVEKSSLRHFSPLNNNPLAHPIPLRQNWASHFLRLTPTRKYDLLSPKGAPDEKASRPLNTLLCDCSASS